MQANYTHVVTEETSFYENSPQQGYSADGTLKAGEKVKLKKNNSNYPEVELKNGKTVFVAAASLKSIERNSESDQHSETTRAFAENAANTNSTVHLDQAELKYGGGVLPLVKSKKYIAVKPRSEIERSTLSELLPEFSVGDPNSRLGGFQLVNTENFREPVEDALDALRGNPAIKSGTHVYHTSDDEVPFVPTGQIFVEYEPEATLEECQQLLEDYSLEIVEARDNRELIVQVTPQSENPIKVAKTLQDSPLIKIAEPDLATPGKIQNFVLPTDERIIEQWHLRNTGFHRGTSLGFLAGADARVIEAWETAQSLGSPNVVVAVIDDGFDLSHPDLTGTWKIVAPKDFTRNTANPIPDPLAEDWHGTACAGVAVGNADGSGIVGAAPRCRLMPVRWGRNLSDGEIESWFGYVRAQGAWVVSCSWGAAARNFALSTRAKRAIERCAREGRDGLGTVICFAAGNENRDINDPVNRSVNGFAIHPDVIAVAASNSRDQRSDYSNFGEQISVCAPSSGSGGWRVTTSDVMGQYTRGNQTFEAGYSPGAYTNDFGGTSSACPLVAGICALILSVQPMLTAAEVRRIIEQTTRKIGGGNAYNASGHSRFFGYGSVDAVAAVSAMSEEETIVPFWGKTGHEATNKISIEAVPGELREFYQIYLSDIVKLAMAADHAKNSDPAERPRHFIDIDLYGEYPFAQLPEDYETAKKKFGEEILIGRGIVPWQIERTYDELVKAFKETNLRDVLRHSAWLGHYVGDAHVPLHTTANHDGQLTGQKGLHSYFESRLLDKHIKPEEIKPAQGQKISDKPHKLAFRWVRESYSYLQPLLDADAANGGKTNKRNLDGFAKVAKPIAVDRLTKGCARVASLWYSAWVEAEKPSLSELSRKKDVSAPKPAHEEAKA